MRHTLILLFALLSLSCFGQKSKSVEIWKKPMTGEIMKALYFYDDSNNVVQTYIVLYAQDSRYQAIVEFITVYSGPPQAFVDFLSEVEKFHNENDEGTSMEIDGHYVSIIEVMGIKGIFIFEEDGGGYHSFSVKGIIKFKTKFTQWANKQGIVLN